MSQKTVFARFFGGERELRWRSNCNTTKNPWRPTLLVSCRYNNLWAITASRSPI